MSCRPWESYRRPCQNKLSLCRHSFLVYVRVHLTCHKRFCLFGPIYWNIDRPTYVGVCPRENLMAMTTSGRRMRNVFLMTLLAALSIQGMADDNSFTASNKALAIERRQSVRQLGLANLNWGMFVATYALDWAHHYATTADLELAQSDQTFTENVQYASWAFNPMDLDEASDAVSDDQFHLFIPKSHFVKKLFGRYPPVGYVFN